MHHTKLIMIQKHIVILLIRGNYMPAKSEKQRRLWGAAYGAKKAGKSKPAYVPMSMWQEGMSTMEEFVHTVKKPKGRKGSKRGVKK